MGDYFERIVDLDVTAEDAPELAERMLRWMTGEGLLTRERSSEGVYSQGAGWGYVPGPKWSTAVRNSEFVGPQAGPVAVLVGRDAYVGGQGMDEPEYARCPRCDARTVIVDYPDEFEANDEVWRPFREGIDAWRSTGRGSAPCPACGKRVAVTEWCWDHSYALGALAFDFWNWPPIADGFWTEFGRRLGHRTVVQMGKF